jgi:hypothetical protein
MTGITFTPGDRGSPGAPAAEADVANLVADLAARAMKARQPINVLDYGADPTGATSSSTAFVNAESDAFILGRSLYVPGGTYLLSASFSPRVPMLCDGPGTTIFTRNGNFSFFDVTGTKSAAISLSADAAVDAWALTFVNDAAVASIAVGDEVNLRSNVAWPSGSTGTKVGETVKIAAKTAPFTATTVNGSPTLTLVSNTTATVVGAAISGAGIPGGTTIIGISPGNKTATMSANATASASGVAITNSNTLLGLDGPIDESYAVANASTIEKLNFPSQPPVFQGFTMRGVPATTDRGGIALTYCRGARVVDVECVGLDSPGVQFQTCVDSIVHNGDIHELTDDNPAGRLGYGVNVGGASRSVRIVLSRFRNLRHSVTTNGTADGVPHYTKVMQCEASGEGAVFDSHEEGRFTEYIDCTVHSTQFDAFKVRAPDTRIVNPTVSKQSGAGVGVSVFAANCSIEGGNIDSANQCIRFNTGATDGRVIGTKMKNTKSGGSGGGVRVDTGADRCIIKDIDARNLSSAVSLTGGSGHHVDGVFADNASTAVSVSAGASCVLGRLDTVNCTNDIVNSGTILNRGRGTLVGGTLTVSTAAARTNSRIVIQLETLGTVAAPKALGVTARVNGTSFTVTSADATDTSTFSWEIFQ